MDISKMTDMERTIFEDCYNYLVRKNEENLKSATRFGGEFLYGQYAEFIFSVGEDLELSHECRFLAIELFNKFMPMHIASFNTTFTQELKQRLLSQPSELRQKVRYELVNECLRLLETQVPLRLMSCVQLASKTCLCRRSVTPVDVKKYLLKMKLNFQLTDICKSEIRVLKTIEFSTNVRTPYGFMELICEFLANVMSDELKGLQPDYAEPICQRILEVSCQLLQFFYIVRPLFFLELYRKVTGNEQVKPEDQPFFARIGSDHYVLAAGIVSLGAYLELGETFFLKIVSQLCTLTSFLEDDILDITRVFGKLLATEPSRQQIHAALSQILN